MRLIDCGEMEIILETKKKKKEFAGLLMHYKQLIENISVLKGKIKG